MSPAKFLLAAGLMLECAVIGLADPPRSTLSKQRRRAAVPPAAAKPAPRIPAATLIPDDFRTVPKFAAPSRDAH